MTARILFALLVLCLGNTAHASERLSPGWVLDPDASRISFTSTKLPKGKPIEETHSFAAFEGQIAPDGAATLRISLDSVDTGIDLRNVRMRFLFFESFKYPEAVISLNVTPEMTSGVAVGQPKILRVDFDFAIHGVNVPMAADILVTAESEDRIVVSAMQPVIFRVEEFGMENNLTKLAETAGGFPIVPSMGITFELAFAREAGVPEPVTVAATTGAGVALEATGDFSVEECVGRFEILSETGNIYFDSGSARLQEDSAFVLKTVLDIIRRCPGMRVQVAGHTDNVGSASYNQVLSERRARSVVTYLAEQGVEAGRLRSTGFGEAQPMVPNDSAFNKSRNRRIEFSLYR